MSVVKAINLALRFLLELCALAALGYWGFRAGVDVPAKIALGLGTPVAAAVLWGAFVAPAARWRLHGWAGLLVEALVLGGAAVALYAAGQQALAVVFALFVVVNRTLLTLWGQ